MIMNASLSMVLIVLLTIGKFLLSIWNKIFFFIVGLVHLLIALSKFVCFNGMTTETKTLKKGIILIALLLVGVGFMYGIYIARFIFLDIQSTKYEKYWQ